MGYFAAALVRAEEGWAARDVDLDEAEDLEEVAEALRDLGDEGDGPVLLLLEQDDEWLGVVRVDETGDPRVFLSDRRAVDGSGLAAKLWDEAPEPPADADDEESLKPVAEPVGDAALLADLGTSADDLLALCAEEGLLPGDVLSAVAERGGFVDVLDALREV